jgi:hypothetical protein
VQPARNSSALCWRSASEFAMHGCTRTAGRHCARAGDKSESPQRELQVRTPVERPTRPSMDTQWPVAIQLCDAGQRCNQMAPFSASRLRAIDQPARPDALATARPVIEQTKPLGAPAAPGAHEHRPKAAVPEAPQPDGDAIFDRIVAEPDARRICVPPDFAPRHQGRHANHRQIVDRTLHSAKN